MYKVSNFLLVCDAAELAEQYEIIFLHTIKLTLKLQANPKYPIIPVNIHFNEQKLRFCPSFWTILDKFWGNEGTGEQLKEIQIHYSSRNHLNSTLINVVETTWQLLYQSLIVVTFQKSSIEYEFIADKSKLFQFCFSLYIDQRLMEYLINM